MALSGPRLNPRSGKATHLVVFVHGYGADGKDLMGLAQPFAQRLPSAAFVAPNGPERCPGAGFQWFPIAKLDPRLMHKGVISAAPVLLEFVESELTRLSLTPDRLALVGFSQGTMMSLHLGLGGLKPAAIVGFSGLLTATPTKSEAPPIFLAHGGSDTLISPEALFVTAGALGAAGVRVQWHLSPGVGHGIDESAIGLAANFLAMAFAGRLAASGDAACVLA